MKPIPFVLILLLFIGLPPSLARAGDAESVAQARALLSPHHWSQAIVIQNPRRSGQLPARVHAAVFSFDGVLWLYLPRQGTQSLSHRRGRLDLDRDNLLPLLQEIQPEFAGYEVLATPPARAPAKGFPKLRNGCFVESLHALVQLLDAGRTPLEAGLFTYYVKGPAGLQGHTGLLFRTQEGMFFWDPDRPDRPRRIGAGAENQAKVAQEVRSNARWSVVRTHFLPIDGDLRRPAWDRPVVQGDRDPLRQQGTG